MVHHGPESANSSNGGAAHRVDRSVHADNPLKTVTTMTGTPNRSRPPPREPAVLRLGRSEAGAAERATGRRGGLGCWRIGTSRAHSPRDAPPRPAHAAGLASYRSVRFFRSTGLMLRITYSGSSVRLRWPWVCGLCSRDSRSPFPRHGVDPARYEVIKGHGNLPVGSNS